MEFNANKIAIFTKTVYKRQTLAVRMVVNYVRLGVMSRDATE